MTLTRRIIINALDGADDYLSADELHMRVREEYPGIGVATVYRTLQLLEGFELVHRIETGEGKARYAMRRPGNSEEQPRSEVVLVCDSCGKVIRQPAAVEKAEALFDEISQDAGERYYFQTKRRTLQLHGICAGCAAAGDLG